MSSLDLKLHRGAGDPPAVSRPRGVWGTLPLGDMDEGDMLEIKLTPVEVADGLNAIRSHVSRFGAQHGKKFSTRTHPNGIRIWRKAGARDSMGIPKGLPTEATEAMPLQRSTTPWGDQS